jgi:hypothetical protein
MMRSLPVTVCCLVLLLLASCYRKDIQFEGDVPDPYTRLVRIDTVQPMLSTVLVDSFATSGIYPFLLGRYVDSYLGTVAAKHFFQVGLPTSSDIPEEAKYDSITLTIKLNKYYYGDTTAVQTVQVRELDETLAYSYNNKLYNSSHVRVKADVLGSRSLVIRPASTDSIVIRLSDVKGRELFSKFKQKDNDVSTADNFLNYLKGLMIAVGDGDKAGVFGVADSMRVRLHYHTIFPYPAEAYMDLYRYSGGISYTQLLTDRTGTVLDAASGVTEFPSGQTNNVAFTQSGAGVLLKMVFPGLRSILQEDNLVTLLHAKLVIRPVDQTYKLYGLPPALYLAHTDATNTIGSPIADSTGSAVLYAAPSIDHIYGVNTSYEFNITPYINLLMQTPGSETSGFYLLQDTPGTLADVNRAVIGNTLHGTNKIQLVLQVLTIKK